MIPIKRNRTKNKNIFNDDFVTPDDVRAPDVIAPDVRAPDDGPVKKIKRKKIVEPLPPPPSSRQSSRIRTKSKYIGDDYIND